VLRRIAFAVVLLAAVSDPAAAANKDIERLQVQVATLQGQLTDLQRVAEDSLREIKRLNETLAEQNAFLRKGVQDRRVQDEAIAANLKDLTDRLSEVTERLQTMSVTQAAAAAAAVPQPGLAPGGPEGAGRPAGQGTVGAVPATTSTPPAPRELYSQAYADYARGNFDLAIQEYTEYLRSYPDTELSDNAQYWIGECLYSKQKYAESIEAWNELFRQYPASDKLPDARFKKGMALERLGRRSQALIEYRTVVERYPNSDAGKKAREKLTPTSRPD
jgi:tol-pal system protein YbgF